MPKVICTRPNASLLINGVNFTPLEDGTGVISEEIGDEAAELFLSIPGYEAADDGEGSAPATPAPAAAQPKAKPATQAKVVTTSAKPAKKDQKPAADAAKTDTAAADTAATGAAEPAADPAAAPAAGADAGAAAPAAGPAADDETVF